MKNKGFTLAELLVTIMVLGLVATLTIPMITGFINTTKDQACEKQKDMILNAAERYVNDNASTFKLDDNMCEGKGITIQLLQSEGYLNSDNLKNPKTKELINPEEICVTVEEDTNYNQYKYSIEGENDICKEENN